MAIKATNTKIRKKSVGNFEANSAPDIEPKNAGIDIAAKNLVLIVTAFRYLSAAFAVPNTEANLLVPKISITGRSGIATNSDGNWINPPPPAIASIKPANPAARIRNKI